MPGPLAEACSAWTGLSSRTLFEARRAPRSAPSPRETELPDAWSAHRVSVNRLSTIALLADREQLNGYVRIKGLGVEGVSGGASDRGSDIFAFWQFTR